MALPISEEIQATQPVPVGLGSLIEQFPLNRRSFYYLSNLFFAVFLLLISAGLIGFGLFSTLSAYNQFGPQVIWKTLQAPLAAGLAAFFIGAFLLIRSIRSRNETVDLYNHGITWNRSGAQHIFFWNEIKSTSVRSTRRSFGFKLQHQVTWCRVSTQVKDLILDNRFEQIESLVDRIQKAAYPGLYMKHATLYNQGALLNFGSIQLDKTGITIHRTNYAWEALAPGTIVSGYLQFPLIMKDRQSAVKISTGQIENLEVLVAILKYILKWA